RHSRPASAYYRHYLLHPSVPLSPPQSLRIADLGAGTGMWVSELAAASPHASFAAFDISAAQYSTASIVLPNVEWREHVGFEAFSEEYERRFDLI
ncbi:hypothetical protein CC86DRAFT_419118, partial [Ophiobolus disseminans]